MLAKTFAKPAQVGWQNKPSDDNKKIPNHKPFSAVRYAKSPCFVGHIGAILP